MEQSPKSSSIWQGTSPQLAFIFGLIGGLAVALILGVFVFGVDFKGKKTAAGTTTPPTTNTAAAQTYRDVKAVTDSDNIRGNKKAKLTLIEYSDYECPFCKTFHPTMKQVLETYKNDVRWVYRHFPLSFHANAPKEAQAALCISDLGGNDKFWEFSDKIFERTTSNGNGFALDALPALAKEIGVDEAKFKTCLDSDKMAARITADTTDGTNGGASGTPTTFIVGPDGKTLDAVPGAEPYEQVKTRIDKALASI